MNQDFNSSVLEDLHICHTVSVIPGSQFRAIGNSSSYEYIDAPFRIGGRCFYRGSRWILLVAFKAEAAPGDVFTFDDFVPAVASNAGSRFHGRTFLCPSLLMIVRGEILQRGD